MIRNAILILLRIYCAFQKCHADSSSSSCLIFQKVFLLLIWSKKSVSSTLSMYKEDRGKRGRKLLFAFSKCFEKLVIFVYFSGENQQTQKNRSIDPLVYSSTLSLILYSIVMVLGKTILIFFQVSSNRHNTHPVLSPTCLSIQTTLYKYGPLVRPIRHSKRCL